MIIYDFTTMDELIADLDDGFIYTVAMGMSIQYKKCDQICSITWITKGQIKIIHLILDSEFSNQFGIARTVTVNLNKRYNYSKDEWNKLMTFLEDKAGKSIDQFEGKLHHVV